MKNKPIRLFEQMIALRAAYPTAKCEIHNNTLWWFGKICPTPLSKEYEVVMKFTLWHNPSIWVFGDNLENLDDTDFPHKYHIDSKSKLVKICLYRYREFSSYKFLSKTIIPWTVEWLYYYEIWLATGEWCGGGEHPIIGEEKSDIKIMPQGSMNLGTVVRPIDDSDDYDMDLVCLLKNGHYLSLYEIKNLVGDRLKEHALYKEKLEPEGKRCWTMQYDEFHMDILPCVPKSGYFVEPHLTAIKLTHKNGNGNYTERFSNPYAYHDWFENRMKDILLVEKRAYASRNQIEISKVPTYKMRTPLQKAIQLLKRHRDICFQADDKDKPISIIITTLAALSYNGESNVYEALCNIIKNMPTFIQCRNGIYWVENPVMPEENFAEKWTINPSKRTAFVSWLTRARKEIIDNPLKLYGINKISQELSLCLGEAPVNRALKLLGEETRLERSAGNLYVNRILKGFSKDPISHTHRITQS